MKHLFWSVAAIVLVAGCSAPDGPDRGAKGGAPGDAAGDAAPPSGVIVHLFEWRWDDIAEECEQFLGPAGYAAVQVSPPTENLIVEGRPWWERYQPVSYRIDTRSGDREAFQQMVDRCSNAGVDIYVDAVINHMTDADLRQGDVELIPVGTAGTEFSSYTYPGLYSYDDFHHCGLTENDDIQDFSDPEQIWNCELVDLADLKTESPYVRNTLAAYMNDLLSLGVAGFRIDAAKHINTNDVAAIVQQLGGADAGPDYIVLEVVDWGGWEDWMMPYQDIAHVTAFSYTAMIGDVFQNGTLSDLHGPGSRWENAAIPPSAVSLAFVDNHDTQRSHQEQLSYQDGTLYELAQVFTLAYPFGRPRVMSSYAFDDTRQGPPTGDGEQIRRVHSDAGVDCGAGRWVCEHRRSRIAGAVGFHNTVAPARAVTNWWSDGSNQIAFARGNRGFVAINRSADDMSESLQTGLAPGTYCDRLVSTTAQGACGRTFVVEADGSALIELGSMDAMAFDVDTRQTETER